METTKINHVFDDIYVIENIIPLTLQNDIIKRVVNNPNFPWYMIEKIGHNYFLDDTIKYNDSSITDSVGFYHSVAEYGKVNSAHFDFFRSILFFLESTMKMSVKDIIRIRLRYTHNVSNHSNIKYAPPHVDFEEITNPYKTLIYYVDDADGDTILFDKIFDRNIETYDAVAPNNLKTVLRYRPQKGHAVLFNGHRYHSGNFPILYDKRIMINFDFTENN